MAQPLTVDEIVDALSATRAEFARVFLEAQIMRDEKREFEAIAASIAPTTTDPLLADRAAFSAALKFAQDNGFLKALVQAIIHGNLESGALFQRYAQAVEDTAPQFAPLQAMINATAGFIDPHLLYRGIGNGIRWTGKIFVDGEFQGTGILIGPHLVLTAWHVVRGMFEQDPTTNEWRPSLQSGERIWVDFDDFLAFIGQNPTLRPVTARRVFAHDQWCVAFSGCHADELHNHLPDPLTQLNGFWDYAIIRLREAPGLERRWASLDAQPLVPPADDQVVLFQFPANLPLKVDQGKIAPPNEHYKNDVPRLRFLHLSNALPGSSGGPCFDKKFTLFGIHQGEWNRVPGEQPRNRGVPIARIQEHLKTQVEGLPSLLPQESFIWNLGKETGIVPVIGATKFQNLVWNSALEGQPRVISIQGDFGSKGTGKTFCLQLLNAMLPDGNNLKIALEAQVIAVRDAASVAAIICTEAGVAPPNILPQSQINSTLSVWLKDEVLAKIIIALEEARKGRLVWVSIRNLNAVKTWDQSTSELLYMLYARVLTEEWLRIVLDGMEGVLPEPLRKGPLGKTPAQSYKTAQPTDEDFEAYLRRFVGEMGVNITPQTIRVERNRWRATYDNALKTAPASALQVLADEVTNFSEAYLG